MGMNPAQSGARRSIRIALVVLLAISAPTSFLAGCAQNVGRAAVTLRLQPHTRQVRDASVIIDEEYVAPLWLVAARGVRLPVGTHRITVQKEGYFPWDKQVVADRQPITFDVELVPIPD
jgi:hypothetical protein